MIEELVIQYLNSVMDVPAYGEVPDFVTDADTYIVVDKSGSQRENHVDAAVVITYSYAPTKFEAAELNEAVKEALLNIDSLDTISAVRLNSDGNATDDQIKNYRYQCVTVITPF